MVDTGYWGAMIWIKTSWYSFTVVLILFLGLVIRGYNFGSTPQGYYWDEVAMLVDAKVVAETGFDQHDRVWWQPMYPSYGDYKLPFYQWLVNVTVTVVGPHLWAVRFPALVIGVMTLLVGWAIARQIGHQLKLTTVHKHVLELTTLLAVSFSPWAIHFSRVGFEAYAGQFFLASSVLVLLLGKNRWWLWLVAGVLGAVATYSYFSVRFVFPVVMVATWAWMYLDFDLLTNLRTKLTQTILKLLPQTVWLGVTLLVFTGLTLPIFQSQLYQPSQVLRLSTSSILNTRDYAVEQNELRQLAGNYLIDRVFFHRHWLLLSALLENISTHLSLEYLLLSGDVNLRHGAGQHGLVVLPFGVLLVVGWFFLHRIKPSLWVWLSIWWLAALVPASVPLETPHALRSLNALVPIMILIGWGAVAVWHVKSKQLKKLLVLGLGVWSVLSLSQYLFFYHSVWAQAAKPDWQSEYIQVADKVVTTWQQTGQPVYVRQFDDRFFLWILAHPNITASQVADLDRTDSWQPTSLPMMITELPADTTQLSGALVPSNDQESVVQLQTELGGEQDEVAASFVFIGRL